MRQVGKQSVQSKNIPRILYVNQQLRHFFHFFVQCFCEYVIVHLSDEVYIDLREGVVVSSLRHEQQLDTKAVPWHLPCDHHGDDLFEYQETELCSLTSLMLVDPHTRGACSLGSIREHGVVTGDSSDTTPCYFML